MIIIVTDEEKFFSARFDRVFKEIFLNARNRDLLITLLETILNVKINSVVEKNIELNQDNLKVRRKNLDILIDTNVGLINIEVNSSSPLYLHSRNYAFLCDLYSHYTLKSTEYKEDVKIIQVNFTYGRSKKDRMLVREYYFQDNYLKKNVKNCLSLEFHMDNIMKFWYSKDEKKIDEYKYLIMLDLELDDLQVLARKDRLVNKFMKEVKRLNEDPLFREYMTVEEDREKCFNSEIYYAEKKGIKKGAKKANIETAKKLLGLGILTDEQIVLSTGLSLNNIEKLKSKLQVGE